MKHMDLAAAVSDEDGVVLRSMLAEWVAGLSGGRSKPVVVWAVDDDVYADSLAKGALPLDDILAGDRTFPSALHASRHLGCKANQVAMAFAKRKNSPDDPAYEPLPPHAVEVRGVTFIYLEDIRDD
jgi:hypothetical protein